MFFFLWSIEFVLVHAVSHSLSMIHVNKAIRCHDRNIIVVRHACNSYVILNFVIIILVSYIYSYNNNNVIIKFNNIIGMI